MRRKILALAVFSALAAAPVAQAGVLDNLSAPAKAYERHHQMVMELAPDAIAGAQQRHMQMASQDGGLVRAIGIARDANGALTGVLQVTLPKDKLQPFLDAVHKDGTLVAQTTELNTFADETEFLKARLNAHVVLRDRLRDTLEKNPPLAERLEAERLLAQAQTVIDETTLNLNDLDLRRAQASAVIRYVQPAAPVAAAPGAQELNIVVPPRAALGGLILAGVVALSLFLSAIGHLLAARRPRAAPLADRALAPAQEPTL